MPTRTHEDNALVAEQDIIWSAVNRFFSTITPDEWQRPHGSRWRFHDVPYHLATIQRMAAQVITSGADNDASLVLPSLGALDAWNDAQFAARPDGQTARESLADMIDSQARIRQALDTIDRLDAAAWLPALRGRGWRTVRFVVAYNRWHNWFHLTEAQLRLRGTMPPFSADLTHRMLDFFFLVIAGAVSEEKASGAPFVWVVCLTGEGGGTWTLTVGDGTCAVSEGHAARYDLMVTTDIEAYFKSLMFGIQRPIIPMLFGRIHLSGVTNLRRLLHLFSPTQEQEWTPME